jgi:hypothetical protein
MRSDLVFAAHVHVSNRYQLTRLVSMATRALHHPGTRIQDTMNDVLTRFGKANPIAKPLATRVDSGVEQGRRRAGSGWSRPVVRDLRRVPGNDRIRDSSASDQSAFV